MRLFLLSTILCLCSSIRSQDISWTERANMPEAVTNNAVTSITIDGKLYLYSFAGLDSTKACGASHLKTWKYDYDADTWSQVADVPDPLGGVVAAGASVVGDKIVVVGGYHIGNACGEMTSETLSVFDPRTDEFTRTSKIPVPIDDHVQSVWRDSLLYIVTGWSVNTNVRDVQIYDVALDQWSEGTKVPSGTRARVFGASGVVIADTIFYMGGAGPLCTSSTSCFKPVNNLSKGAINPQDPTDITWIRSSEAQAIGYRTTADDYQGNPVWLGGSDITYNFDGIDYNGSGAVPPAQKVVMYSPRFGSLKTFGSFPPIMDHRGHGRVDESTFLIAGGLDADLKVSNKLYEVTISGITDVSDLKIYKEMTVYPNPTSTDLIALDKRNIDKVVVRDQLGRVLGNYSVINQRVDVSNLPSGFYYLRAIDKDQKQYVASFVKQ